jgi:hypothetical protein
VKFLRRIPGHVRSLPTRLRHWRANDEAIVDLTIEIVELRRAHRDLQAEFAALLAIATQVPATVPEDWT